MDDERLAEMDTWIKSARSWGAHQAAELMAGYKDVAEQLRKIYHGPVPTPPPTECSCVESEKADSHCPQHWQDAFPPRDSDASWRTGDITEHPGPAPYVTTTLETLRTEFEDHRRLTEALEDAMDRLGAAWQKIDSLKTKLRRVKKERNQLRVNCHQPDPDLLAWAELAEGQLSAALNATHGLPSCGIEERDYEGCYVQNAVQAVRRALDGDADDLGPAASANAPREPEHGDRVKVEITGTYCTDNREALHGVKTLTGSSYFYSLAEATFTVLEPATDA